MASYGIADRLTLIGMIGTIAKETAHRFAPIHEFGTRADWAGYSGGADYAGRGFIQVTHDYNYKKYGDKLGVDLLHNPDLALDPVISAKIACEYWVDHGISAMCQQQDWLGVRRAVYGGTDQDGAAIIQQVYNQLASV